MRLKVAIRNVFRNKRRTALNVFMIAGGVSALIVFSGFVRSIIYGLRDVTIKTQTGHIQVATPAYWAKTAQSPKEALMADYGAVQKRIARNPYVRSASGRLTFFGLLSKGDRSTSAQGMSFDPTAENLNRSFKFTSGKGFEKSGAFEVAVGSGLAANLGIRVGDQVTVLANTYDGVVNALDLQVVGTFTTAVSSIDDRTFLVPLLLAQKLLDTKRVEQIVVSLKDTENTDLALEALRADLGGTVELKAWYEVAKLYRQVEEFNRVQNEVLKFIILSLILLGILNTIGMSVFERTGEIGTIAALGETASSILKQFVLEGAILGLLGALAGVGLGALLTEGINSLQLSLVMPGASQPLTIVLGYYFRSFFDAAILSVIAGTLAAIFPAFRASRMNIANALRHNL
ncbi:ABC transporter permease [bacterium]|nr:ABC transporter permease [bacterium]